MLLYGIPRCTHNLVRLSTGHAITTPLIIPRTGHNISRTLISQYALKVLYRLKEGGFLAYLVGGGVRDLLLGREPKDFDIVTNARPEQVAQLFRNCRLIGRRFRLAHIHFGQEIIEVATFRAAPEASEQADENGRLLRDNVYGDSVEEDVWRRDFTVNALYYDIRDFSVVDYCGGMQDLKNGVLRLIGEPEQRLREDPVRMLRAARFAAKLGFRIDPATEQPLLKLGHLLEDIPPARLFEEVLKLFMKGAAVQTYELLRHYRLFGQLFPQTEASLEQEAQGFPRTLLIKALENTDARIAQDKPVTPAFLFAALLWEPARRLAQQKQQEGMREIEALQLAAELVVARQLSRISLPRRFSTPMREIWLMQPRFLQQHGKRPLRLLTHPRFRAAYDFLLLRGAAGEVEQSLCDWWSNLQTANPAGQQALLKQAAGAVAGAAPGKKRRRRRRKPASATPS